MCSFVYVRMFHMLYSIVGDGQDILMELTSLLTTLTASIKGKNYKYTNNAIL